MNTIRILEKTASIDELAPKLIEMECPTAGEGQCGDAVPIEKI